MKTAIYFLALVSAVLAQTPRVVDQVDESYWGTFDGVSAAFVFDVQTTNECKTICFNNEACNAFYYGTLEICKNNPFAGKRACVLFIMPFREIGPTQATLELTFGAYNSSIYAEKNAFNKMEIKMASAVWYDAEGLAFQAVNLTYYLHDKTALTHSNCLKSCQSNPICKSMSFLPDSSGTPYCELFDAKFPVPANVATRARRVAYPGYGGITVNVVRDGSNSKCSVANLTEAAVGYNKCVVDSLKVGPRGKAPSSTALTSCISQFPIFEECGHILSNSGVFRKAPLAAFNALRKGISLCQ